MVCTDIVVLLVCSCRKVGAENDIVDMLLTAMNKHRTGLHGQHSRLNECYRSMDKSCTMNLQPQDGRLVNLFLKYPGLKIAINSPFCWFTLTNIRQDRPW